MKSKYKFQANCKNETRAKEIAQEFLKDLRENPKEFNLTVKKIKPFTFEIIAEKRLEGEEETKEKKCICPEIDRAIRREARMYSDPTWNLMTSNGFYNWG
jgi:hypothetical protein